MAATEPADTPRTRLAALPPVRRAALLDPAEAEFAAHGFSAASMNRILAAAGMSKGQAYYYVTDKADLYAAVIERALARLLARIPAPATPPHDAATFTDGIAAFLDRLTEILMTDPRLGALARGIYDGPETHAALAGPMAGISAALEAVVREGQALGAIRRDLPRSLLTAVLFAAAREIDRWFALHTDEMTPDKARAMNAKALDLIRAMAAPPQTEG